jgi:hypothetical protein
MSSPQLQPATKRDILIGWTQQFGITTRTSGIITATLLIMTFLSWSHAVIAPFFVGSTCPDPDTTIVIFPCAETLFQETTSLTGQLLGLALPLITVTYVIHEISESRINAIGVTALAAVITAAVVALYLPVAGTSIILFGAVGRAAALWPLLIIVPMVLKARKIIRHYREWEKANPVTMSTHKPS